MARELVPSGPARVLSRPQGSNLVIVNQSAVDVYFSDNPSQLNASIPGQVPNGTKIAAAGGEVTITSYKAGGFWMRAATDTELQVSP
jgi:hypothetical protein